MRYCLMAANALSSNRLKLVKSSSDDPKSMEIVTRMGMSVAEFMNSLSYSQLQASGNDNPRGFVWPKHTELEIRNPYESVYQYEPTDSSWALRFRALGCYSVIPKPIGDLTSIRGTPPRSNSIDTLGGNTGTSFVSTDRESLKSLLKSRCSNRTDLELPSETITQAERHKLLEDLRLTDSEDDESGFLPTNKMGGEVGLDAEQSSRSTKKSTRDGRVASLSSASTTKNALSALKAQDVPLSSILSETPLPFVSPLSVMGDDGVSEHPCRTPLRDSRLASSGNSTKLSVCESQTDVSRCIEPRNTECSFLSSKPVSDCLQAEKLSSPRAYYRKDTRVDGVRHSEEGQTNRTALMNSPDTPPNASVTREPTTTRTTEQARSAKNNDYVQRILRESETILAAEQRLLVAGLSSPSPIMSSDHGTLNEEILLVRPITRDLPSSPLPPVAELNVVNGSDNAELHSDSRNPDVVNPQNVSLTYKQSTDVVETKPKASVEEASNGRDTRKDVSDCPNEVHLDEEKNLEPVSDKRSSHSPKSPLASSVLSTSKSTNSTSNRLPKHTKASTKKPKTLKNETENSSNAANNANPVIVNEGKISEVALVDTAPSPLTSASLSVEKHRSEQVPISSPVSKVNSGKRSKADESVELTPRQAIASNNCEPDHSETAPVEHWNDDLPGPNPSGKETTIHSSQPETCSAANLRAVPERQWVFPNVALKKVRSKLLSITDPKVAEPGIELVDKIRAVLLSISSTHQVENNNREVTGQFRTLTGLLLVPLETQGDKGGGTLAVSRTQRILPDRQDATTMTLVSPMREPPEKADAEIQCTFSPVVSKKPADSSDLECQSSAVQCQRCQHNSSQSTSSSFSMINTRQVLDRMLQSLSKENQGLRSSSVEFELASADECKASASRCWKVIVGTVSTLQCDTQTSGSDRSHLLLTLDSLHLYPVHLILGVRHCLAAIHLLHAHGDVNRAADLCVEVVTQLEHIGRRLHRVEAKLVKHRSRRQQVSDSAENDYSVNAMVKAKRDAEWIHFWYYVLARIRSIILWHEYHFRMLIDSSFPNKIGDEFMTDRHTDVSNEGSYPFGADDECKPADRALNSRSRSSLSPSSKNSPVSAESKLRSAEMESVFPPAPNRTSAKDRIQRLSQMNELMQRSFQEWKESEKLAPTISRLFGYSLGSSHSPTTEPAGTTNYETTSASIVDYFVTQAGGGVHLISHSTDIVRLLCFIDGVVWLHKALLEFLKLDRSTNNNRSPTEGYQDWISFLNRDQAVAPSLSFPASKRDTVLESRKGKSSPLSDPATVSPRIPVQKKSTLDTVQSNSVAVGNAELLSVDKPDMMEAAAVSACVPAKRKRISKSDRTKTPGVDVPARKSRGESAGMDQLSSKEDAKPLGKSKQPYVADKISGGKTKAQDRLTISAESGHRRQQESISQQTFETRSSVESVFSKTTDQDRDSQGDSPNYEASTPSPPPIRRRSKSMAPVSFTQHSSKERHKTNAEPLAEAVSVKRKAHPDHNYEKDGLEETTYKPKRIRSSHSSHDRQQRSRDFDSSSPEPTLFPSYRPSDPDEIDKARMRRCASVGRSLSRSGMKTTLPVTTSHPHSKGHQNQASKTLSAVGRSNGFNAESTHIHSRVNYSFSKDPTGEAPPSKRGTSLGYQEHISQGPSHVESGRRSYETHKR